MLTFSPPGESPDFAKLARAGEANPDGFGFAIIDTAAGRIISHRTLDLAESLAEYRAALALYSGASLWHARWATHGATDLTNVHPFQTDNGATVIGHNGIIPVVPDGTLSDTATFVRDYWPAWSRGAIDDPTAESELAKVITGGSKLVVLTVDPRYKRDAYIVNEAAGHWLEGTWYSNYSYVPYSVPWKLTYSATPKDDADYYAWDEIICPVCDVDYLIDYNESDDHYCPDCDACYYCERDYLVCDCMHFDEDAADTRVSTALAIARLMKGCE